MINPKSTNGSSREVNLANESSESSGFSKSSTSEKQKWALITGASSGIGWSVAESLAGIGYHLLVCARRAEKLTQLKSSILDKNPSRQVIPVVLDISDRLAVDQFFMEYQEPISQLDLLVNNAGLAIGTDKVQDSCLDDWEVMINTNLKGLLYMTHGVAKSMFARNRGDIINIGSVAGRWVYTGGAVYCATKFAVSALTEGLRMDLSGTPIRVMNIEPGRVNTEFSRVRFHGDQQRADAVYEGMTPLYAQDIAEAVVWCVQRPPHVNIQELVIFPTDQASLTMVHKKPLLKENKPNKPNDVSGEPR